MTAEKRDKQKDSRERGVKENEGRVEKESRERGGNQRKRAEKEKESVSK